MEREVKQIRIKNQDNYHYSLKKQALIKRINDYEHICSVIAPLHWITSFASEKGWNKYLAFDNSFAGNKELLK